MILKDVQTLSPSEVLSIGIHYDMTSELPIRSILIDANNWVGEELTNTHVCISKEGAKELVLLLEEKIKYLEEKDLTESIESVKYKKLTAKELVEAEIKLKEIKIKKG